MNKLWAFGCSMTAGEELFEPTEDRWSRQLADRLGLEEVNCAVLGCSNSYIMRKFLNNMEHIKGGDSVVIMWTHPERREVVCYHDKELVGSSTVAFKSRHARVAWDMHKQYLTDDILDLLQSVQIQLAVYRVLETMKNVRFRFMFWAHDHYKIPYVLRRYWQYLEGSEFPDIGVWDNIESMRSQMKPYTYTDNFFKDLSIAKGYPLGPKDHPTEIANDAWTNLIYSEFV